MAEGCPLAGGLSEVLWRDSLPLVYTSLHHPFVKGLAFGTLPRETFKEYVAQDVYYLSAFAKAYALALAKSTAHDQEVFDVLSELLVGVNRELRLHGTYAKEWGIDLTNEIVPNAATLAYCDFLLGVAEGPEGVAHIMAAMTPCSRLYGYLGSALKRGFPHAQHAYARWIDSYSSPGYLELAAKQEAVLDQLGASVPFGTLRQLYRSAMQLEVDFFAAQPGVATRPGVGLVVVDFDETCTTADTTACILDAAAQAAERRASGGEASTAARQAVEAKRDWLVANYGRQREALLAQELPPEQPPAAAYEDDWLAGFIDRLSAFDRDMNTVVVKSGVLAGIPEGAIAQAARQVALQPGCRAVLRRAQQQRLPVTALSVSWSSELVTSVLHDELCPGDGVSGRDHITVIANDLAYSAGVSTGKLIRRIECGSDKGARLESLILDRAADGGQDPGLTVYVGDSASDIAPMMVADVGIVVGSNGLLRRVLAAAGVQLRHLIAAPMVKRPDVGILYEAASWSEIEAFLFGARAPNSSASNSPKVPRVLTVAGSDSGGGAGIQADLKTFMARGAFGASAVTALTAQNTHGVQGVHVPPVDILVQQMDAVLSDIGADVVKTGMLPTAEVVAAVAERVRAHGVSALVVDPVLVATSGHSLASSDVLQALRDRLLPLATIVTPNIPEASALLGGRQISCVEDMKAAAVELHALGPSYVLIKGGHLLNSGTNSASNGTAPGSSMASDVLYDGTDLVVLESRSVRTANTHGTGCTLASAIAAELAKGSAVPAAVRAAKRYLTHLLRRSAPLAIGRGVQRPMNHGFETADWAAGRPGGVPPPLRKCDLRVYVVTDPGCNAKYGRSNAEAVRLAVEGGATLVQLREKDADGGPLLAQAREVVAAARPQGVAVVINDRLDVALAAGADGVHVGQDDLPAAEARALLGAHKLLGVSVKTVQQALQAQADGADYLGAGAVFPTTTKDSSQIGLDTLADICKAVSIPVVAIGGITAANAASTIHAGCAGVAVVSTVFAAADPDLAAQQLRQVVDAALEQGGGQQ